MKNCFVSTNYSLKFFVGVLRKRGPFKSWGPVRTHISPMPKSASGSKLQVTNLFVSSRPRRSPTSFCTFPQTLQYLFNVCWLRTVRQNASICGQKSKNVDNDLKIGIQGFLGSLITNPLSEIKNSKWRTWYSAIS